MKVATIVLEGTEVRANASKHKAMSCGRMQTVVTRLEPKAPRPPPSRADKCGLLQ